MKQYVVDGLRPQDHEKLKDYLKEHVGPPMLGNIYWLEVDEECLTDLQKEHEDCRPHVFALELEQTRLSCELLVRIKNSIHCDCMGYADKSQRDWLMETVDGVLEKLQIKV